MTTVSLTDLVEVPGGSFQMGSDAHYLEESPGFRAQVEPFAIEQFQVTNAQFARFIEATGYVTIAERPLDATEYPQMSEQERAPGSLVFTPADGPVDLTNWRLWWRWQTGANWRMPHGPEGPAWQDRADHPVVQVCFVDSLAYAAWAWRRLPTEAEFEFAARGGLEGTEFAWGDELRPGGQLMANTWQGRFPYDNTGALGWVGTAPVGTFPANGFGIHDMIGNAWEWTTSTFTANHRGAARTAHTADGSEAPELARMGSSAAQPDPGPADLGPADLSTGCGCGGGEAPTRSAADQPAVDQGAVSPMAREAWAVAARLPDSSVQRVAKGGSHLCAPEYCMRYRPAARSPQTEDSATSHIGFRCAL